MEPKKTALYDIHVNAGARIVEFAGYLMPVQYKGIIQEHKRVRSTVGMFDVSHMGEFFIRGSNALEFLQSITLNDVSKLKENRAQYNVMCYDDGGIVDDFILYRMSDGYLAVVNASNRKKDFEWMHDHLISNVELSDASDEYCLFALQGRKARDTLLKIANFDVSLLESKNSFYQGSVDGTQSIVANTGYTGEDGFEIAVNTAGATALWRAVMDAGKEFEIEPIGLGARDTLRLEAKFCLYGSDIDQTTNPIEAGLGWVAKVDKGDFVGRDAIVKMKEAGAKRKLVGFEVKERAVARHEYRIFKDNAPIGYVTSGTFSPSLGKSIGMGYVDIPHHEIGSSISIAIRNKKVEAEIVKTPFYHRDY